MNAPALISQAIMFESKAALAAELGDLRMMDRWHELATDCRHRARLDELQFGRVETSADYAGLAA